MKPCLVWFLVNQTAASAEMSLLDACKDQSNCESCYASSFLCHWCKDMPSPGSGSCHYKMSQYGCQVGDSCSADDCAERTSCWSCQMGGCKWCASANKCVSPYSWTCALPSNCAPNSECQREAPEFVGYERSIPDWLIYAFAVVYIIAVVISMTAIYYVRRAILVTSPTAEQERLVQVAPGEPRLATRMWLFRLISIVWSLALVAVGVIFVSITLYWPSPPDVSMCNAQVMWSDTLNMIINSVTSGKASVESEVLITVYNPNRLGLALHSVNGNIFYKGTDVGSLELSSIDAQAGTAADGLGVVTFNGFDHIAEMYYDFNVKHQLLLEFELFVNFSIAGFNGFNVAAPKLQLNVNNPPPQKRCKCINGTSSNPIRSQDMGLLAFEFM